MYFDEVYHARTAFELLAEREPYEWTHPHLAKEIMALGILAFGDDRVVGAEPVPPGVSAFAVTNDGTRVFGLADGTIEVRPRDAQDSRVIGRVGSIPRSVAVDGDHVYVVADRDLADLSLTRQHFDLTRPLTSPPTAAAIIGGRLVVGSATETSVYVTVDAEPTVITAGAVGLAAKNDGSEAYLLDPTGAVHVFETAGWTE